jgi:imidazolonepropionase-like amidohydrolase
MNGEEHSGSVGSIPTQQDHIDLIAAAGLHVTSTLGAYSFYLMPADSVVDAEDRAFLTPAARAMFGAFATQPEIRHLVEAQQRLHAFNLGRLHAAGALIAAGTDAPGIPHGMHLELERLVAAGLSPAQAIAAATVHAARALGADADIGSIAPGRLADLLILDEDPLLDIRNTRTIRHVIQGGHLVERRKLRGGSSPDPEIFTPIG